MRLVLILLLLAAALWRAVVDWQATIGQGYAYRFASIEAVLAETWPERWSGLLAALQARSLWEPVGATLAGLPLAPVLAGIAVLLWLTRRPNRGR